MNLICPACRQSFSLENINIARVDFVCPNPLCGKVNTLDVLMEHRYGLEVGIRVRTIISVIEGKRGPCSPDMLARLNWRVEQFSREQERMEQLVTGYQA